MAHIVVMEDDHVIRELVERFLVMSGHTVYAFDDAKPVLDMPNLDVFDLFLTDLAMPTSGEVAIRTLRHRGILTPIVVMSGQASEEKTRDLMVLGANAVIAKPFSLKAIVDTIEKLIH